MPEGSQIGAQSAPKQVSETWKSRGPKEQKKRVPPDAEKTIRRRQDATSILRQNLILRLEAPGDEQYQDLN